MMIAEVILLKKTWNQKMRLRNTVSEVWLSRSGEEIEIVYLNKLFVGEPYLEKTEKREP
jgi:hypothetical protein